MNTVVLTQAYTYKQSSHTKCRSIGLQVVCLGKEERLLECAFPENFGSAVESDLTDDDYLSQAAASPASTAAPGPGPGLPGACSFGISDFSVVCRRFEITGAMAPRAAHHTIDWQLQAGVTRRKQLKLSTAKGSKSQ